MVFMRDTNPVNSVLFKTNDLPSHIKRFDKDTM